MKRILAIIAAGVVMMAGTNVFAQNDRGQLAAPVLYGGVGPAIAGSIDFNQLPKAARDFAQKHFKDETVIACEKEFYDNTYEVEFSDGTDIEFDAQGNWVEIDAGRRKVLPEKIVKKLLPDKARHELERRKVIAHVESVKRYDAGYKVEIRNAKYDDFRFAKDGKLLGISD